VTFIMFVLSRASIVLLNKNRLKENAYDAAANRAMRVFYYSAKPGQLTGAHRIQRKLASGPFFVVTGRWRRENYKVSVGVAE